MLKYPGYGLDLVNHFKVQGRVEQQDWAVQLTGNVKGHTAAHAAAEAENASFQLLNCGTNEIIDFGDSRVIPIPESGTYALITTQNGCVSYSECFAMEIQEEEEGEEACGLAGFKIYPNPTENSLKISHPCYRKKLTVMIYAIDGKTVLQKDIEFDELLSIDMQAFIPGAYYLRLVEGEHQKVYTSTIIVL